MLYFGFKDYWYNLKVLRQKYHHAIFIEANTISSELNKTTEATYIILILFH